MMAGMADKGAAPVTLTQLVDAIGNKHDRDPSRASLILSSLGGGEYYASAVRYNEKFGEGKVMIANAKASSLSVAVKMLAAKLEMMGLLEP
jgi:hypothetical protein